jgi:hypothetical protein
MALSFLFLKSYAALAESVYIAGKTHPAGAGPEFGPDGGPSMRVVKLKIASLPHTPHRLRVEFETVLQFSQ